jgi:hypothetical protein
LLSGKTSSFSLVSTTKTARGFRVARVRAHEMTVAGLLGPAFAGAIGGYRAIVDLALDRPLQDSCIDEGGLRVGMRGI